MRQGYKILMLTAALTAGSMVNTGSVAHAKHEANIVLGMGVVWGGVTTTSIVMSSLRLGQGEHAGLGLTIFSATVGGLNLTAGGIAAVNSEPTLAAVFLGLGALNLTLAILGRVMNAPPDVVVAPTVSEDVAGNLSYGLGLTLLRL